MHRIAGENAGNLLAQCSPHSAATGERLSSFLRSLDLPETNNAKIYIVVTRISGAPSDEGKATAICGSDGETFQNESNPNQYAKITQGDCRF
jgi:hypothetical protein